eukprot:jgi/Botrbrau1/17714/Bobra.0166s0136.1
MLVFSTRQSAAAAFGALLVLSKFSLGQEGTAASDELAKQLAKLVNGTLPNYVNFGYGAAPNSNAITAKGGISIRPRTDAQAYKAVPAPKGLMRLGLSNQQRDGYVFVPASYSAKKQAPLILALHGANKTGLNAIADLYDLANQTGTILVAPDSRDTLTWDMFNNGWGPDVAFINGSLAQIFDLYNISARRIAIEGFSDGATYALSLGIANGALFSHVLAFSPGGLAPPMLSIVKPGIFISAGRNDYIFPMGQAGNQIVCQLLVNDYNVTYDIFAEGHVLPPRVARRGMAWFLGPPPNTSVPLGLC